MNQVLLLEPHQQLSSVYARFLENLGYSVTAVRRAQDAVSAADEKSPDLVVAELQLPTHNGIEFLYEFRSYYEWQAVPIIILTMIPAHSLQIEQSNIDRLGIADILYKPTTTLQTFKLAVQATLPL